MASTDDLIVARKLLAVLDARQSQGSLASQAKDCVPIVEVLGYYDLADFLRGTYEEAIERQDEAFCDDCADEMADELEDVR